MWPTLLTSVTVIGLMVAVWANLQEWADSQSEVVSKLAFGLLMGSAAVLSMSLRGELVPGVLFDLRNVAVGLAGLFGGVVGLAVAWIMSAAMRVFIGGVGLPAAIIAFTLAGAFGLVGRLLFDGKEVGGRAALVVASGVALAGFAGFWLLPEPVRDLALVKVAPAVVGLSFLTTALAAFLMIRSRAKARERLMLLAAVRQSPDYLYVKDRAGRFVEANQNVAGVHGRKSPDDLKGLSDWDLESDKRAQALAEAEHTLLRTGEPIVDQLEEVTINGRKHWFETTKVPVRRANGDIVGLVGATQDITALKQLERELREHRDRLATIQREMADGMAVFDKEGTLIEANDLYRELFPLTGKLRVPGAKLQAILAAAADCGEQLGVASRKNAWIAEVMATLKTGGSEEVQLFDGRWLHVRTKSMHARGAVVLVSDITLIKQHEIELQRMTEELHELASTDGLTGLKNRRSFDDALAQELFRARRIGSPTSVILLDIDRFKAFNDTYGHPSGDACLRRVAAALQNEAKRPADVVARYGGEEFVVILPDTDEDGAFRVAENIRKAVRALGLEHSSSEKGVVTVSLGIATATATDEPLDLLTRADVALYEAKTAGRDRVMGWRKPTGGSARIIAN